MRKIMTESYFSGVGLELSCESRNFGSGDQSFHEIKLTPNDGACLELYSKKKGFIAPKSVRVVMRGDLEAKVLASALKDAAEFFGRIAESE